MPTRINIDVPVEESEVDHKVGDIDETSSVHNLDSSSEGGSKNNDTTMMETSVNMLVDESLQSSHGDGESDASMRNCNKSHGHLEGFAAEKSIDVYVDFEDCHQATPKALQKDDTTRSHLTFDNDETRFSDSDSDCSTPQQRQHNKQSPTGIQKQSPRSFADDETRMFDSNKSIFLRRQSKTVEPNSNAFQKTSHHPNNNETEPSDSDCTSSSLREKHSPNGATQSKKTNIELSKHPPHRQSGNKPRRQQWSRQSECNQFKEKFDKMVSDFQRQHSRAKLRVYSALNTDEQRMEQEKVMNLLDRLCIRERSPEHRRDRDQNQTSPIVPQENSYEGKKASMTRLDGPGAFQNFDDTMDFGCQDENKPLSSNSDNKASQPPLSQLTTNNSFWPESDGAKEIVSGHPSLSSSCQAPTCRSPSPNFTVGSSIYNDGSPMMFDAGESSSFSEQSVEITRGARNASFDSPALYQSPAAQIVNKFNRSKRLATTSGKRGNDKFRTKLNQDSFSSNDSYRHKHPTSSQLMPSSDDSFSLPTGDNDENMPPFSASQSPIDYQHMASSQRCGAKKKIQLKSDISRLQEEYQFMYRDDDTIESVDDSFVEHYRGRGRLREVSRNVALKEGAPFHYNPLLIKRSMRTSRKDRDQSNIHHKAVDFRDPLEAHLGQEGKELYQIYEWMHGRDDNHIEGDGQLVKWNSASKGIIFSLTAEQIVNVSIKLLIEIDANSRMPETSVSSSSSLSGQTLIVVRSKEDVFVWERALREQTPFSVTKYQELASDDRKRASAPSRYATKDIVICTYDDLKFPDSTIRLDENGHAITDSNAESQMHGGWLNKRGSSSAGHSQRSRLSQRVDLAVLCKKYSALHRLLWRRIIFTDVLGRKSYLAKAGTVRASASIALNANTRFAFFTKVKDTDDSAFESLIKSDKRAVQSVASVLRIEIEDDNEALLDLIIDPIQGI